MSLDTLYFTKLISSITIGPEDKIFIRNSRCLTNGNIRNIIHESSMTKSNKVQKKMQREYVRDVTMIRLNFEQFAERKVKTVLE